MKLKVSLAVLMAAGMLLGGCGKAKPVNNAKTPKDALGNFADSISKKDKDYFMSCISVTDAQKPQAQAWFDLNIAMFELQEAMKKSYGDLSLRASNLKSEFPGDKKWLEQLEIKEEDSNATATDKSNPSMKPIKLVKQGQIWKVVMDVPLTKEQMESITKAVKDQKDKVGKAGYTPQMLEDELGNDVDKLVPQAASKPGTQPATKSGAEPAATQKSAVPAEAAPKAVE